MGDTTELRRDLELWLVRHGETTFSLDGRLAGWTEAPLSARGEEEARSLAPRLDGCVFDGVWSSDRVRAVTTARLAWGEPRTDPRLREMSFGDLEGKRWSELGPGVGEGIFAFRDFRAPGGESVDEVRDRVLTFVAELPPGRHLVFTHGGVIRVLTRDLGLDRFLGTGALAVVDWPKQRLLRLEEPHPGPQLERPNGSSGGADS
jgi:probable phosphoglycerate mutase